MASSTIRPVADRVTESLAVPPSPSCHCNPVMRSKSSYVTPTNWLVAGGAAPLPYAPLFQCSVNREASSNLAYSDTSSIQPANDAPFADAPRRSGCAACLSGFGPLTGPEPTSDPSTTTDHDVA